ncbi:unnamed protein product [Clonostachys solani]|uniref:Uncharacterized protein n=1 Tax=Clonostachys solani TaxID=160281 RepID=A0A9N9Z610_9HYPO|nr:unnamed protein product [Clonostachys solani]
MVERHILVKWVDKVRMEWGELGTPRFFTETLSKQGEMDTHGALDMDARIQVAAVAYDGENGVIGFGMRTVALSGQKAY